MNYLLVVAHPDDEVLGAGATIKKLVSEGNSVDICIMSSNAEARSNGITKNKLKSDMKNCFNFLGINNFYLGTFENIKMNSVPHLELVQFIENAIKLSKPDIIITHHPSDINNDHMITSLACQAAARLCQRKNDVKMLKELWFMEVLSSTDWATNKVFNNFNPNIFVEVGKKGINDKIKALRIYSEVIKEYPHPRSVETIKALATYRGSQFGCIYAEAFECVLRRL